MYLPEGAVPRNADNDRLANDLVVKIDLLFLTSYTLTFDTPAAVERTAMK